METVDVLVRIPKEDFDFIKDEFADGDMPDEKDLKEITYFAIAKGKVLPKGHGRLKAEPTEEDIAKTIGGQNDFAECIREAVKAVFDNAPTIIEADKDFKNI